MRQRIFIFIVLFSTLPWSVVHGALPLDMRIVVDISETMQRADPDNLRGSAIELLVHGLPDDAQAGIWAYARHTVKVVDHAKTTGLWKQIASIRGSSLSSKIDLADPGPALRAATWDLAEDKDYFRDVVLFSDGSIRLGGSAQADQQARQQLIAHWATKLKSAKIRVHTIELAGSAQEASADADLLRQLAEVSGGVYRQINSIEEAQQAVLNVQQVAARQPQAVVDDAGRFQVAPGAQRLTLLWFSPEGKPAIDIESAQLFLPDGTALNRLSPVPDGRWLVARDFEIVTLNEPQPGWWRVQGPTPDSLTVLGELEIRVEGLQGTVVPAEESNVTIKLFNQGRQITHPDFLKILEVRAWLVHEEERLPLPIDQENAQYTAFFVNLEDGSQKLEVEVVAPTFQRRLTVPFVVANPLVVEVVQNAGEAPVAWLQFGHPQVDYATVRATGITRKPPQIASLVPAQQMPAGLWRIPIDSKEGIVQLSFSVAGNYLDGQGLFLKTKPHAVSLPIAAGERLRLRFDASGKLISDLPPHSPGADIVVAAAGSQTTPAVAEGTSDNPSIGEAIPPAPSLLPAPESSLPHIPVWFVALISVLNLAFGGLIWWFNKPKPIPPEIA